MTRLPFFLTKDRVRTAVTNFYFRLGYRKLKGFMEKHPWLINAGKSDYVKLVPILGLAFYLAFIPHQGYPYPVHLDEWIHFASSNEIIKETTAFGLTDPFLASNPIFNQLVEVGFHTFWAMFHQISDIPWLMIFKYFPAIISMMTVLSVYVLAQRRGFGWEAAFITTLIPTTVGILGPGFLVPVALGLLFISLALFVAFNFRSWGAYVALFIFSAFLFSMHAATAIGLITILTPYIILNLKSNFKHSLGVALAIISPLLVASVAMPALWDVVAREIPRLSVQQSPNPYIELPVIIQTYGYYAIMLCLGGALLLAIRGGIQNYALALGLLILLALQSTFYALGYGIEMMYYRGFQFSMLMMSIVAGAGLMEVKNLRVPERLLARLKAPSVTRNIGYALCLILIGVTLYVTIPDRQSIRYYHMIDDVDYEAFIWIRDNVDGSHQTAILDPWKGPALTSISGKNIYAWIGDHPGPSDERAYAFLRSGSKDTSFLEKNGISIIYTRENVNNTDLTEVRKYVYLLEEITKESE